MKTGKIRPEQAGQPGAGAGVGGEDRQRQELAALKQIMTSPEFQRLDPEKQKKVIQKARGIIKKIKGGK